MPAAAHAATTSTSSADQRLTGPANRVAIERDDQPRAQRHDDGDLAEAAVESFCERQAASGSVTRIAEQVRDLQSQKHGKERRD